MHGVAYTPPIFKFYNDFTANFSSDCTSHSYYVNDAIVPADLVTMNKGAELSGRRSKAPSGLLETRVRIPPGHGSLTLVNAVCCEVEVSATVWTFLQRSPTDCGVFNECDTEASTLRRLWPTTKCCAMGDNEKWRIMKWRLSHFWSFPGIIRSTMPYYYYYYYYY